MRTKTLIAAIAVFAGAASWATAPPAWAESPAMSGIYTYTDEDGVVATWIIHTTCTPDCVAHVTDASNQGFDAPLVDGRYIVTRTVPEAVLCPAWSAGEGGASGGVSLHPVNVVQWWNPLTLNGEVDFLESGVPCAHDRHDTFTLTKIG
jgi:hypothetical protein